MKRSIYYWLIISGASVVCLSACINTAARDVIRIGDTTKPSRGVIRIGNTSPAGDVIRITPKAARPTPTPTKSKPAVGVRAKKPEAKKLSQVPVVLLHLNTSAYRWWRSNKGSTIRARLSEVTTVGATLLTPKNRTVKVRNDQMSPEDIVYIAQTKSMAKLIAAAPSFATDTEAIEKLQHALDAYPEAPQRKSAKALLTLHIDNFETAQLSKGLTLLDGEWVSKTNQAPEERLVLIEPTEPITNIAPAIAQAPASPPQPTPIPIVQNEVQEMAPDTPAVTNQPVGQEVADAKDKAAVSWSSILKISVMVVFIVVAFFSMRGTHTVESDE